MNDPHYINVIRFDPIVDKVRPDDLPSIFSGFAVMDLSYFRMSRYEFKGVAEHPPSLRRLFRPPHLQAVEEYVVKLTLGFI